MRVGLSASVVGAVVIFLIGTTGSVQAQTRDREWKWCKSTVAKGVSDDLQIAGCTGRIQSAQETSPNLAITFNNRGIAYSNKGQYDLAIADYNQAISLKPDYAAAFYNRGVAHYDKGQYNLAIADYSQAISLKPDYADAFNNRGNAYRAKGQYDLAIADYNQAISLKPDYADAFNNRGMAYRAKARTSSPVH